MSTVDDLHRFVLAGRNQDGGWRAHHLGFVAMGRDLVAVDATCARIIGLDPVRIPYLREASGEASEHLGNIDAARIDQGGEQPARYETSFDVVDGIKRLRLGASGPQSGRSAATSG